MSINLWRYVRYTDDGCAVYQCLKCSGKWEARDLPGWTDRDSGVYTPVWKFCPLCGTQWEGARTTDPTRSEDQQVGPRRARIDNAIEARDWELRYRRPEPMFYWLIEERVQWLKFNPADPNKAWTPAFYIEGLKRTAAEVLAAQRAHLTAVETQHAPRWDDEVDQTGWAKDFVFETRVRKITKAEWDAKYARVGISSR